MFKNWNEVSSYTKSITKQNKILYNHLSRSLMMDIGKLEILLISHELKESVLKLKKIDFYDIYFTRWKTRLKKYLFSVTALNCCCWLTVSQTKLQFSKVPNFETSIFEISIFQSSEFQNWTDVSSPDYNIISQTLEVKDTRKKTRWDNNKGQFSWNKRICSINVVTYNFQARQGKYTLRNELYFTFTLTIPSNVLDDLLHSFVINRLLRTFFIFVTSIFLSSIFSEWILTSRNLLCIRHILFLVLFLFRKQYSPAINLFE